MIDLSPTQAAARIAMLLKTPQSQALEFKRVSGRRVGKALETICACANPEGGVLALAGGDGATGGGSAQLHDVQENPKAADEPWRNTRTQLHPSVEGLHWLGLPCTLNTGDPGHIVLLRVEKGDKVHSIPPRPSCRTGS